MATKAESTRFRADIEGLRAVAVLGVCLFHSGVPHIGGGYVGVDVFYVISGFLITGIMLRDREVEVNQRVGSFLASFYARRVRRILPAASLVVLTTLLGATLLQNPLENARVGGDATSTTLFFSNVRFAHQAADYFAAGNAPSPFLQYWSLSLEEQFYLLWPIVFFVLVAISVRLKKPNVLGGTLIAIICASLALSIWSMRMDAIRAFYLLPPRAWELGIGALLALNEKRLGELEARTRAAATAIGLVAILATMALYTAKTPFPGLTALPPTLGAALVILGGCGSAVGVAGRFLALRPMQLVGRYSFSLYLWHWPALVLKIEHFKWIYTTWTFRTAFMFVAALPAAALTYHLVENPLRRARSLRDGASRSLAVGVLIIGISLAGIWAFEHLGSNATLSTTRQVAVTNGHLGTAIVPTDFVPSNLVPPLADTADHVYAHCDSPCIVGPANANHKIVLFGNSHAGHWGGAFELAAPLVDARVEIHSPGGCTSYLIPVELLAHTNKRNCEERRKRVFDSIESTPPDIVVLSNMSLEPFASNPAEWERGVREAIRRIPKSVSVLVFAETPEANESLPLCLVRNLEHADRCDLTWPVEINAKLQRIATEEGAVFVDLRPLFCTDTRCPAITEDMLIYADNDHLTPTYGRARSEWLVPLLQKVLAERDRRNR